ncbi:MAG: Ig-like domain-containing protein [Flavobacterium sp.]|nr:Ig-like domain-containing protein [Flavobacterium sp.]
MKTKKLFKILALLAIVLFQSCSDDEEIAVSGLCPLVISTIPSNGALNVPLDQVISATFNKQMRTATITNASFTVEGLSPVNGVITFEDDAAGTTAKFTPTGTLLEDTTYTGRIKTTVKDQDGNALQIEYVWNFSTGVTIRPIVIATDPINLATGVPLNKVITATFSEAMDPLTITNATFTLMNGTTAVPVTFEYFGELVSFTPLVNLLPNTTYTATITNGAQNLEGTSMVSDYVWSFTTGTLLAPTVILTDPLNNATNVPLNKVVTATFSEVMNPATLNNATFTLMNGTVLVPVTFGFNGTLVSFTPTAGLLSNTTYTATITTGAQNPAGVGLTANYIWSFTTGSLLAPTVILTDPLNNATNVPQNKVVTATFSEVMNPATINNSTFTLMSGTVLVPVTFSFSGAIVSFTPSSNLLANTTYTATITTGAQNPAGVGLASNYIWNFTTGNNSAGVPIIGSLSNIASFGGSAGLTNQGINTVINNGGISTTAASTLVTGFHDGLTGDIYTQTPLNVGLVTGGIYTAPPTPGNATSFAIAQQALLDANALYISLSPAVMPGGIDPGAGELGGLTLAPGVYKSNSGTFNISNGNLTLDAQGDPNAVWVFQTATGLTVGIAGPTGAKSVILTNGASASNVFWQVGSTATINGAGGGVMVGTIVANSGVTLSTAGNTVQTVLNGRAISLISSVTMVNTTINVPN